MRSNRAFTLIELLVVIAIIAILAAILFPVFASAREKARSSMDMSNQRQIGLGLRMYLDDHAGTLPQAWDPSGRDWAEAIEPYIKMSMTNNGVITQFGQVWRCPSAVKLQAAYSLNAYMAGGQTGSGGVQVLRESQIEFPSKTLLVSETTTTYKSGALTLYNTSGTDRVIPELMQPGDNIFTGNADGTISRFSIGYRHPVGSRVNILFADLHVSSIARGPWVQFDSAKTVKTMNMGPWVLKYNPGTYFVADSFTP